MNDLSPAGQFADARSFQDAIGQLMRVREEIQRLGSSLYCHRRLVEAQVAHDCTLAQAVQLLPEARRRALMLWLTRQGPYWEDARLHDPEDWLEVNGAVVTDTAVGEAAICCLRGLSRELVSFTPSNWIYTPIEILWRRHEDGRTGEPIAVPNHWETASVQQCLATTLKRIESWNELAADVRRTCTRLTFVADAFQPLDGHPFVPGAAARIRVLLNTLNELRGCFNDDGSRTPRGHEIYNEHFTGAKAWFSDSSDTEKRDFNQDLTFPHPDDPARTMFCTWHGKVKTPQIRIHFSWPVRADSPVYIVYVGPKITKT